MKVSLFYIPTYVPSPGVSPGQLYRDILEEVEFADQNGFAAAWFAEHHFLNYGGMLPSVPVIAAAAAQRTTKIRIGSGIALIGLQDPVRVAEQFAMLDHLSDGRLDFGIGRAFQRHEFEAFEIPMEESRARFDEAHDIIMSAWRDDKVTFAGKYRRIHELSVLPKPLQQPHPPVYVACTMTTESFAFTAKKGYHLMYVPYVGSPQQCRDRIAFYRDQLAKAGHDPSQREVMVCLHFFHGESAEHARDYPRPYLRNYLLAAAEANKVDADPKQYEGYGGIGGGFAMLAENYDRMYPGNVIFGNAEQCLERIAEFAEMGATQVSLITNFGGMPHREIMRSLERFAKTVMPRLPE